MFEREEAVSGVVALLGAERRNGSQRVSRVSKESEGFQSIPSRKADDENQTGPWRVSELKNGVTVARVDGISSSTSTRKHHQAGVIPANDYHDDCPTAVLLGSKRLGTGIKYGASVADLHGKKSHYDENRKTASNSITDIRCSAGRPVEHDARPSSRVANSNLSSASSTNEEAGKEPKQSTTNGKKARDRGATHCRTSVSNRIQSTNRGSGCQLGELHAPQYSFVETDLGFRGSAINRSKPPNAAYNAGTSIFNAWGSIPVSSQSRYESCMSLPVSSSDIGSSFGCPNYSAYGDLLWAPNLASTAEGANRTSFLHASFPLQPMAAANLPLDNFSGTEGGQPVMVPMMVSYFDAPPCLYPGPSSSASARSMSLVPDLSLSGHPRYDGSYFYYGGRDFTTPGPAAFRPNYDVTWIPPDATNDRRLLHNTGEAEMSNPYGLPQQSWASFCSEGSDFALSSFQANSDRNSDRRGKYVQRQNHSSIPESYGDNWGVRMETNGPAVLGGLFNNKAPSRRSSLSSGYNASNSLLRIQESESKDSMSLNSRSPDLRSTATHFKPPPRTPLAASLWNPVAIHERGIDERPSPSKMQRLAEEADPNDPRSHQPGVAPAATGVSSTSDSCGSKTTNVPTIPVTGIPDWGEKTAPSLREPRRRTVGCCSW